MHSSPSTVYSCEPGERRRICKPDQPTYQVCSRLLPVRKRRLPAEAEACHNLGSTAHSELCWERSGDSTQPVVACSQLQRADVKPLLHPVPEEVANYIHVYWSTLFQDYLDSSLQKLESNLQDNWSFYHREEEGLPQAVLSTYQQYILEPVYEQLSSFFCSSNYSSFPLTASLLLELLSEVLAGNISQQDSLEYMQRALTEYRLRAAAGLLRTFRESHPETASSAAPLVVWLEAEEREGRLTDTGKQLARPASYRPTVEKLFLKKLLWERLYPQRERQEYEQELRQMLTEERYEPGQVRQLLAYRLPSQAPYQKLEQELRNSFSSRTHPEENSRLFLQELQLYTLPFRYNEPAVEEPQLMQDPSGRVVVYLISKEQQHVIHGLAENVFLPLPASAGSHSSLQSLQQSIERLQRSLCGSAHRRLLQSQLSVFRATSGLRPFFYPAASNVHIQARRLPACPAPPASPGSCSLKRARTGSVTPSSTTYLELARRFFSTLNSITADDKRQLYADWYRQFLQQPLLPAYTTAYGEDATKQLLRSGIRQQLEQLLASIWDSIQARFVLDETGTAVYPVLALAMDSHFHSFLSPLDQEVAEQAWQSFEAAAHEYAGSRCACKPESSARVERLRCVLRNTVTLLRMPPSQLRLYYGHDIDSAPLHFF